MDEDHGRRIMERTDKIVIGEAGIWQNCMRLWPNHKRNWVEARRSWKDHDEDKKGVWLEADGIVLEFLNWPVGSLSGNTHFTL